MTLPNDDFFADDEDLDEGATGYRPGLLTIIISVIIMLALLTTLIAPLFRNRYRLRHPPTPTPDILQEAYFDEHSRQSEEMLVGWVR